MHARASYALPLALLLAALAACSTSNSRRDLEFSGSLPRAIGLGAFAPTCLAFCFVSADFTQGDTVREDVLADEVELSVHTEQKKKGLPR